jgi:hypothetical protein
MNEKEQYGIATLWTCNGRGTVARMRKAMRENPGIVEFSAEGFAYAERLSKYKVDGHLPRNWKTI